MTCQPSIWCSMYFFFFHNFLQISLQKSFEFIIFFYNFLKIKMKSFECPKSIKNHKKNNACNIRRLVDKAFVPVKQQTSVLYYNWYLLVCKSGKIIASWRRLWSKSFPSINFSDNIIENIKKSHYKNFVHLWNYMTFLSLKFNLEPFCLFTNCYWEK